MRGSVFEADPISACDPERVDVVYRKILDVGIGELGPEEDGVQHLSL